MTEVIGPGGNVGILGGGQLGRMLAMAAARLGIRVHVYDPAEDCPAAHEATHVKGGFDDVDALRRFAETVDVVTYEFENIPEAALDAIESIVPIRPGRKALATSQDRLVEKSFLRDHGIGTADFAAVDAAGDIAEPLARFGGQGILKTRRDGYDGKGQVRVASGDDFEAAHKALAGAPAILEALVPFEREVSVILARAVSGETLCFDVPRNEHVNGILKRSSVPSGLSETVEQAACEAGAQLANALGHIGVLSLEFFVLEDGTLLANEFAPRVHNSGHWTPEACQTGQFEQHIRAIAGWPLAPVKRFHDVEMRNLLGEEALQPPHTYGVNDVITLYGKREAKAGRKMGHVVTRL